MVAPRPSGPSLLEIATEVLLADPAASLADVARTAGIGRTTLHRHYPTRRDLLVALAEEAMDLLERLEVPTEELAGEEVAEHDPMPALHGLVKALIPLGPRLMFLLRAPELDGLPEIGERMARLDEPVRALVHSAQARGALDEALPAWWVLESLYALVNAAWEQIRAGRLAPLDAPALVTRTWLAGAGARR